LLWGQGLFLDRTKVSPHIAWPNGAPTFGTRTVVYRIVAVRSTARGDVAEFPVNLGVSGKMPAQFLPRDQYNAAA